MNRTIPALRFKGYSSEWKPLKLGQILEDFEYGLNAPSTSYDGINKYLRITDIDDYTRKFKVENITSPDADISEVSQYMLKKGDIVFARTGASVGKTYLYDEKDGNVFFAGYLIRARIKRIFDEYFVFQNTLTEKYNRFIKVTSQRSGQPGVNAKEFSIFNIYAPLKEEQQMIGKLFKQLDDTIALQQQLIEQQQQYKKAMLQKMFPQKGGRLPKIRFDGFNGEWVFKKIIDLVTPVTREVPKPNYPYKRLSVRSHAKGTFQQLVDDPSTVSMDKLYVVRENDLVVNITFAWEHAIAVAKKEDDGLLVSHRFPTFVIDKSNTHFIHQLVSRENFRRQMEIISPGGAGRNRVLNKSDFMSLKVLVPESIEEQQKIGAFFKQLDDTIAYHEKKLENYKQLKKALLQRMFV
ncbi:restriction endonuclease subunit S [Bacillaceae bacterium W0354]